jgi:outer membrane murein-binding lipoprotein Lpp
MAEARVKDLVPAYNQMLERLDEIDRVISRESGVGQVAAIQTLVDKVRDLTAQVAALNYLDEEAADEAREWKARAERAERAEARQENQDSCLRDTLEENRKLKDLLTEERRLHGLTVCQVEAAQRDKSALSLAIHMRKELTVGKNEGDVCGRDECPGILAHPPVKDCTCHLSPPCNACVENLLTCSVCGWDERDT